MTDAVEIALIGSVSATVVGLFNAWVILKTHKEVQIVKEQTNGIQSKLLVAEKGLSYQEGLTDQRKDQLREDKNKL